MLKTMAISGALVTGIGAAQADVDMWPFIEWDDQNKTVMYPFYANEENGDFKMRWPLYYKTNQGRDSHYLWPSVKFHDGQLTRFAPFWFGETSDDYVFFPFVVQKPGYSAWLFPPAYTRTDGTFKAFYPFYVRSDQTTYIFPNILRKQRSDSSSLSVFPFYSNSEERTINGEQISRSSRFLNYYSKNDLSNRSSGFFPFWGSRQDSLSRNKWFLNYYSSSDNTGSKRGFFPFWGDNSDELTGKQNNWFINYSYTVDKNKERTQFFPLYTKVKRFDEAGQVTKSYSRTGLLYQSQKGDSNYTSCLPLFIKESSPDEKSFWALNYYSKQSSDKTACKFWPFYGTESEKQVNGTTKRSTWAAWPLYSRSSVVKGEKEIRVSKRFLIFTNERTPRGRTFKLFGIPLRERVSNNYETHQVYTTPQLKS